jgi:hypothetical protein
MFRTDDLARAALRPWSNSICRRRAEHRRAAPSAGSRRARASRRSSATGARRVASRARHVRRQRRVRGVRGFARSNPKAAAARPWRATRRHAVRRRGRDRGDHLVHEYVEPAVMLGAGLLAKKAVERGLTRKPWVKTSPRAGFESRHRLSAQGRPAAYLDALGFNARRLRLHDVHRQQRPAARRRRATVAEKT